MTRKSFVTPLEEVIKKFTRSISEPPEIAMRFFIRNYSSLFDNIGYVRDGVKDFDKILSFMAHYQIAVVKQDIAGEEYQFIYETQLKDKEFCLPKGLLLYGACGTGKTLAARVIASRFGFHLTDTHRIGMEYQTKEGNDWLAKWLLDYHMSPVVIDDLGAEGDIKKFGNESPVRMIIAERARCWELYGTPTIYTTNLSTPKQIAEFYGNDIRILDRLTAYQVGVVFAGASLRK
jgi:hypothetical protein